MGHVQEMWSPNKFGEKSEGTATTVPKLFGRAGARTLHRLTKLEVASPDALKIFRQCRSTALQKTIRYSLLATRCRFG
jgi:hypothetical protein